MSTATGPDSGYADCDEYIAHRIAAARSRIKWTDLLTALLLAGVLLIGYVLVFTVFDHWIVQGGFSAGTRAALLGIVVCVCAAIVIRFVIRPWMKQIHPLYAARMLDSSHGTMDGALVSLVDLESADARTSLAIRRTIEKKAAVGLAEVDLDEAIDRKWLMNLGLTLFILVLVTCAYAVFSPKTINLLRPLSLSAASVATQTRILRVQPGETTIQTGGDLEVVADIGGAIPDDVHVLYSTQDQTYVNEVLTMSATDDAGRFRVSLVGDGDRGLRQNFSYQVSAGDAVSEVFHVIVDEPPTCSVTELSYSYPDYMGLPDRTTKNANIDAWEGSRLSLKAVANVPIRLAILQFSRDASFSTPDIEIALQSDGAELSGEFPMQIDERNESPTFYRISLTDEEGRRDPQPTVYSVKVRPDQEPTIRLLDPSRDLRVPANAVVPLLFEAADPDFLLRSVRLEMTVNNEPQPRLPEQVFDGTRSPPTRRLNSTWDFELQNLNLKRGDVVEYFLSARDNRRPRGNRAVTDSRQLFIDDSVSEQEVQEQLAQDREAQEQQLRENGMQESETASDSESASEGQTTGERTPENSDDGQSGNQESEKGTASENSSPNAQGDEGKSDGPEGTRPTGTSSQGSEQKTSDGSSEETTGAEGRDPAGRGTEKSDGEVTDDDALQKLLDAYKDAIEEAEKKGESQSTDGRPNDQQPDTGQSKMRDQDNMEERQRTDGSDESSDVNSGTNQPEHRGDEAIDDEPGMTADQPGQTGDEPGQTGDEPGQTGDEPGQTGDEPGQTGDEPGQTGDESGKQGDESGKQGGESGEQGDESGKQGDESGKQGGESGKQGGESGKQGDESGEQGDESGKQGGESGKQGGESGKQGGESGKQGGESGKQGGESGKQGGESGAEGGKPGGPGKGGGKADQSQGGGAGGGGKNPSGGKKGPGGVAGGEGQSGPQDADGTQNRNSTEESQNADSFQPDAPNVVDAAQAADLVLKRLKRDLDRGQVDDRLLEKLGWDEEQLKAFSERMQKQLSKFEDRNDQASRADKRQRRRFEELLKSLDLKSASRGRVGNNDRDREVQDTTSRQTPVPSRYRDRMKLYERSLSDTPTR